MIQATCLSSKYGMLFECQEQAYLHDLTRSMSPLHRLPQTVQALRNIIGVNVGSEDRCLYHVQHTALDK